MKKPARIFFALFAVALASLAGGCASGVTRSSESKLADFRPSSAAPLSSVKVQVSEPVKEKLKDSLKFDERQLARTIEMALSSRALLSDAAPSAPSLHVYVTHVRVRSTFNAVMWGAMSGNDAIEGEVQIKDATGAVLDKFEVKASYALGGFAGGQDSMRMGWLYEAFAKELAKELSGESDDK
jgi:hypothetical protein